MSTTRPAANDDSTPGPSGFSIDVTRDPDEGILRKWTAVEKTTGREASGPAWSLTMALLIVILLFTSLFDDENEAEQSAEDTWKTATADAKRRFDEEDVTSEDVDDGIEWARSQ